MKILTALLFLVSSHGHSQSSVFEALWKIRKKVEKQSTYAQKLGPMKYLKFKVVKLDLTNAYDDGAIPSFDFSKPGLISYDQSKLPEISVHMSVNHNDKTTKIATLLEEQELHIGSSYTRGLKSRPASLSLKRILESDLEIKNDMVLVDNEGDLVVFQNSEPEKESKILNFDETGRMEPFSDNSLLLANQKFAKKRFLEFTLREHDTYTKDDIVQKQIDGARLGKLFRNILKYHLFTQGGSIEMSLVDKKNPSVVLEVLTYLSDKKESNQCESYNLFYDENYSEDDNIFNAGAVLAPDRDGTFTKVFSVEILNAAFQNSHGRTNEKSKEIYQKFIKKEKKEFNLDHRKSSECLNYFVDKIQLYIKHFDIKLGS